ncbi:MAG: sensor histidine kinase [Ignavibacteriota bacterium]
MVNSYLSPKPRGNSSRLVEIQEIERRHLARELHDEIGQLLSGLRLMLRSEAALPPDALRARLDQAQEVVDEILARVRRVSVDLRPADLDQLGLLPALLSLCERFTGHTGIKVNFRHAGIGMRFAPQVETAAYRIVQEALTNVARHAGVPEVRVHVWSDGELLNLQVQDAGFGFVPADALAASRSSGLMGMRERASLVGGSVRFESAPQSGTTVAAELPLAATEV